MISMAAGRRTLGALLPPWWLMLITGIGWTLVALILLRFDYTSVSSIAILFGFVALFAGAAEVGLVFMAAGWWKLLHAVLAFIFIVTGIVAFIHPGNTFLALAAVFSFFLIFAGTFDIIISISTRHEIEVACGGSSRAGRAPGASRTPRASRRSRARRSRSSGSSPG